MEIHCGNLPFDFDDAKLRAAFATYGKVESAEVIMHKFTGKSRGFGFVTMPNSAEAKVAIATLSGKEIDGRTLRISEARPEKKFGNQE